MARRVMPQKPRAVIFDWDDTLVDTWHVVHQAVNVTLAAMGHHIWSEEEARRRLGPPARALFSDLFGADQWQEADAIYIAAYKNAIQGHIRAFDESEAILKTLKAQGVYLCVLSAKRGAVLREEARILSFDKYFGKISGAGDEAEDKPLPSATKAALAGWGHAPDASVWFVGDSKTDLEAAYLAGCTAVLIGAKIPAIDILQKYPPQLQFTDHEKLLEYIKSF
jgi:phosphoglycolate phosphatase